ncbi:MAG: hypothetical protein ACLPH3_19920 [Terracidiphilus sp.]
MRIMKFVLMAAIIAAPAITFAQTPAPAPQNHTIRQREFNQHRRIANGFRNGRLNARQTARLERQQRSIHRQMHMMRARHNGRLTPRDRRFLTHRQNVASRRIFRAKHNRRIG